MTDCRMNSAHALVTAQHAFLAINAGKIADWRSIMELRRSGERAKKEMDRKLMALCDRAIAHPDFPAEHLEDLRRAFEFFQSQIDKCMDLNFPELADRQHPGG